MIKKLALAVAVCVAGGFAMSASPSEADDCRYRRPHHRGGYAYRPPIGVTPYSVGVYRRPAVGVYSRSYYSPYSSYRSLRYRSGRYGYGYGVPRYGVGYPGFGRYGRTGFGPYGRSGLSIGIGF